MSAVLNEVAGSGKVRLAWSGREGRAGRKNRKQRQARYHS